jgi:hypothetical protein
MKRLSVPPLAVVCLAVAACATGQAGASDGANATDSSYLGADSYGTGYSSGAANFAPAISGYSGPKLASFPRYGYAGYGYPLDGNGYAGYGFGGYISYGFAGYGGCGPYGGCNVKLHNPHPPRGYRCGPNAGGSCSYVYGYPTTWGPFHRCHLWRTKLLPCSVGRCGIYGPTFMDPTPARAQDGLPTQPGITFPNPAEMLQPPSSSSDDEPLSPADLPPSLDSVPPPLAEPPSFNDDSPSPGDDSST